MIESRVEGWQPETVALQRVPRMALLDHVGSSHYTPFSFAREVEAFGASRRVPRDVAARIAAHLPLPLVFSHAWMPILEQSPYIPEIYNLLFALDEIASDVFNATHNFDPTYADPEWGLRSGQHTGKDHWIIPLLKYLGFDGKEAPLSKFFPKSVTETIMMAETIFGATWVTRAVYVTQGDETDDELERLIDQGIEPVIADNSGAAPAADEEVPE